MQLVEEHIRFSISLKQSILSQPQLMADIASLGKLAAETLSGGGKIVFAGNGGSFADAQHLAAEFVSKLMCDRLPLPALALGTNSSAMSAIGNDYGYEYVFSRELQALAGKGDLFVPITTSGNSRNIIQAAEVAKTMGLNIVGLTGETGGSLSTICPCLKIPSSHTALIQESHIMIGHIICGIAELQFIQDVGPIKRTVDL